MKTGEEQKLGAAGIGDGEPAPSVRFQRFTRREIALGLTTGAVGGAAGLALGYKNRDWLRDIRYGARYGASEAPSSASR